jgi:hypothetical protein
MIDVEPRIHDELQQRVPLPDRSLADWEDALRRAGLRPRFFGRPRLLIALAALALLLAVGGALAAALGGFSGWLSGEPGKPAPPSAQRAFDRALRAAWVGLPTRPQLRLLLETKVGKHRYTLYGFRSGDAVCLRLGGEWRLTACVTRAELERSHDLVIPVKANASLGQIGTVPRTARDRPTVPEVIVSFGFAAIGVRDVQVASDRHITSAILQNGAFLAVLDHPARGEWMRTISASSAGGQEQRLPLLVMVSGQPPVTAQLPAKGPLTIEREVKGGTIGWFTRREPRGDSLDAQLRSRLSTSPPEFRIGRFARLIEPDPNDILRMVVAEHAGHRDEICFFSVTIGGAGGGCRSLATLFELGPLALTWGFSGGGQQIWTVEGMASDDVTRVEAFLATGERLPLALRDNVVIGRIAAVKLPARIVAYDDQGRIIGITKIPGLHRSRVRPVVSTFRTLIRIRQASGQYAALRIARSTTGGKCFEVRTGDAVLAAGCYANRWRGPALQLGVQGHGRTWLLNGRVRPTIAGLELRYQDGDKAQETPVEGYVLVSIPKRHTYDRHRLTLIVGRDSAGRVVGREQIGGH